MAGGLKKKIHKWVFSQFKITSYEWNVATDKYYGKTGRFIARLKILLSILRWKKRDLKKIKQYKDIHKGKRAFIICNGPSLTRMDLSPLKNEITFGLNAIYLMFDKMDFEPTYLVCEDLLVAEDRADEINQLKMVRFHPIRLSYCIKRKKNVIYFKNHVIDDIDDYDRFIEFCGDLSKTTFGGQTVTFRAMQIAFYMGIRELYLIGADHSYQIPENCEDKDSDENYVIDSENEDLNHFDSSYFGNGYRWHNPKTHLIEKAYKRAKLYFETFGGTILNATQGGKLEVFPRVDYSSIFLDDYENGEVHKNKERFQNLISSKQDIKESIQLNNERIQYNLPDVAAGDVRIKLILQSIEVEQKGVFNESFPPMPIMINPFRIFQMGNDVIRIYFSKVHDYFVRVPKEGYYSIEIHYYHTEKKLEIRLNDLILLKQEDIKLNLGSRITLGCGNAKRFWNGNMAEFKMERMGKRISLNLTERELQII